MESQRRDGATRQGQNREPPLVIPKVQLLSDDPTADLSLTPIPLSPLTDVPTAADDYLSSSNVPNNVQSNGKSGSASDQDSPLSSAVGAPNGMEDDPQTLEEESRKIQENLRQWKDKEQRRRAQNRRSTAFITPSPSLSTMPISEAMSDLSQKGSNMITRATSVRRHGHLPRSNSSSNGTNAFRMSFSRRSVHVPGSSKLNDVEMDERSPSPYSHPLDTLDESGELSSRSASNVNSTLRTHNEQSVENFNVDSTTNLTRRSSSDRDMVAQGVDFVSAPLPLQSSYKDNDNYTSSQTSKPHSIQTNPLPPVARQTYEYSSPSDISESPASSRTQYRTRLVKSHDSPYEKSVSFASKNTFSQSTTSLESSSSSSSGRKMTPPIRVDFDPKLIDSGMPSSLSDEPDPYAALHKQRQQGQNNQLTRHNNGSQGGLLDGRKRFDDAGIADESPLEKRHSSYLCAVPAAILRGCFTCFLSCCCAGENSYLREQEDEQAARTNPME